MVKKIAVIIRDRQSEALRMATGIILLDDIVDVYVLGRKVEESEQHDLYLETFEMMEMNTFSDVAANSEMTLLTMEEIAAKLPSYDHVLAY